ncbi:MAG TPA: glycosyltransferase [Verrucomicrobiae bacterium]|jgi:glycosyltransferase involved in cell wall biosynthesis|nr:glycosyltransferase [Verrucomicrobiae bacterium]
MPFGVSVTICCYNSARRLGATLAHLAAQVVSDSIPWEVLIIDNNSNDGTGDYAKELWAKNGRAPLRVILEPRIGLAHARERGFEDAKHEIVSFVDDDNWVSAEWVSLVSEVMESDRAIGACGGLCEAVFETPPPLWFSRFQGSYAVGGVTATASDVTWTRGFLFGAGLSIRKQAWMELRQAGFLPGLSDRKGNALASGGDTEICRALRLANWKLRYDPRLCLKHFMPSARLDWNYLRRLRRALGASTVGLDAYTFATRRNRWGVSKLILGNWVFQTVMTLKELASCGAAAIYPSKRGLEGNEKALQAEFLLGRLNALLESRADYGRRAQKICQAPWRKVQCAPFAQAS